MTDLAVRAVMTGDQSGLVGAARSATAEVDKLTAAAQRATSAGTTHGNVVSLNTRQITELSYAARHLTEELAAGYPVQNIVATQLLHLSAAFGSVTEAVTLLTRFLPFAAIGAGVAVIGGLTAAAIMSADAHDKLGKEIEQLSTGSMSDLVKTATELHDKYGAINDLELAYVKLGPQVIDMTNKIAEAQKKAAEKAKDSGWWTILGVASSSPEAVEYGIQSGLHPDGFLPPKLKTGVSIPLELDAGDTASSAASPYQDAQAAAAQKLQMQKEIHAERAAQDMRDRFEQQYREQTNAYRFGFKMPGVNCGDILNIGTGTPQKDIDKLTQEEQDALKQFHADADAAWEKYWDDVGKKNDEFADRVKRANVDMADNVRQSFAQMGADAVLDFNHMGQAALNFT